jgi:Sap-like sulfolipid-1-addressing protein
VNGEFFVLAFTAALNPKLLALDLLLIENRRPRAMFACILAGGLGVAIAIGLVDVLLVHADAVRSQGKVSAGVDLAVGLILLALGGLLLTGLLPRRPEAAVPAADREPAKKKKEKGDGWAQRALREPRLGLAVLIGALVGLPGASYIAALHSLITGNYATGTRVAAVIVFAIIEFLLIIIPWAFLELRPEGTTAMLRKSQAWLAGHAKQLMAWIALLLGAYLAISALVRLL